MSRPLIPQAPPSLPRLLVLLGALACKDRADTGEPPAPDLTQALGAGEARAGVVTDPLALFGGLSAEGQVGDIKIYNAVARFVIQGDRSSGYYVQSGGVIDADLVRPDEQPGRDLVDEWQGMFGLGRLQSTDRIEIVDDGSSSGRAVVRVTGVEIPMALVLGALDSPDAVPDLGLTMVTTYTLPADSPLLEVQTVVTATDGPVTVAASDILIGSLDASFPWRTGAGFGEEGGEEPVLNGFLGKRNEGAVALLAPAGGVLRQDSASGLLGALGRMAIGSGESTTLEEGDTLTWTRFYAVGEDLAALTDAWLTRSGVATQTVEGVVQAPDGPVAGARVNILADGEPYTVAITDAEGRFSALLPAEATATTRADGRGVGLFLDTPEGAAPYGPYAPQHARDAALNSLREGALPIPQSLGRGLGAESDPLTLLQPGSVTVTAADGLPFEVRLTAAEGSDPGDDRLFPDSPSGRAALGWTADGSVTLTVEPGEYSIVVWRGVRHEVHTEVITVSAGQDTPVAPVLTEAYPLDGWITADPHSHAAPSGDGSLPMEDRLRVAAGVGIRLHFGTDHDHIADYRPLLEPLGLSAHLASVVADEISPVPRGHVNAYPLESAPEAPSGGAWLWWEEPGLTTDEQFEILRARHPDVVLQLNHPLDNGVPDHAGWSPGQISSPERWTEDFDAVEVLNDGEYTDYYGFWQDAFLRGILSTPVGVSDSHGHLSGRPGLNLTFLAMDPDPAAYTDDALRQAMSTRASVASFGPFIDCSLTPGQTVTEPTTVQVEVKAPSWIVVDTLTLVRNGEAAQTVGGTSASFTLEGDEDAAYWVVASGSRPMQPIQGAPPWAMTSPWLYDADADGWEPPLPPLEQ